MTTPLREQLADYLALRRALGYRLARPEKLLNQFIDYVECGGETTITVVSALSWARLPGNGGSNWWAYRLAAVRGFATYLHGIDTAHEVPTPDLLPQRPRRASPYLYSEAEIAALIAATSMLSTPLRRATFATLIGLLAVTGIRVGDAIALDRGDVDLTKGRLTVRYGKFGKTRELALHPSTVAALRRYRRLQRRLAPATGTAAFFVSQAGTPADLLQRPPRVPPGCAGGRADVTLCVVSAPDPRSEALVRGPGDARCLCRRRRRAGPADAAVHLARSCPSSQYVLVPVRVAGADGRRRATPRYLPRRPVSRSKMSALAPTLQAFFTDRLIAQRNVSGNTIAAYRDTLRLLLRYASDRTGRPPSRLDLADLDAPLIAAFLNHLEAERGNSVRTRNARLAAIHSLFRYAALAHPDHAETIARVLAIPPKRFDRALVTWLDELEVEALITACDLNTWTGQRDHALLLLAVQTGLRISELIGLVRSDLHLGAGAHVACHGKGRKDRITPLTTVTVAVLRAWLDQQPGDPTDPLFPTRRHRPLSRDAVEHRLAHYTAKATASCPSLHGKTITTHVLRHTTAMRLLHAGVDTSVIALWLGHVSVETTQIYLHADLELKDKALARTRPPHTTSGRYQPPDTLLAWLEAL